MPTTPSLPLSHNARMPQIGFGLWKNSDEAGFRQSVEWALQAGYRHFDTAQAYGNEQWLGAALAGPLKDGTLKREDLFITTKIAVQHFGKNHTPKSFEESFKKLRLEYVDLVLLHFPVTLLRHKSWEALEEIQASGRVRQIGVSNYTVKHLKELLGKCKVKPVVNQVELHVFLQQPELLAYCKANGIVVEAYSPLAHARQGTDDPVLQELAAKYGKSPQQVMLRWCIEQGTVPLPKSVHKERIVQNIDVFDFSLDSTDMRLLRTLNQDLRTCWDPTRIP